MCSLLVLKGFSDVSTQVFFQYFNDQNTVNYIFTYQIEPTCFKSQLVVFCSLVMKENYKTRKLIVALQSKNLLKKTYLSRKLRRVG